jgi:hypothetical protein
MIERFAWTTTSLDHWRQELSLDDRRRILAVVRKTSLASLCTEYN